MLVDGQDNKSCDHGIECEYNWVSFPAFSDSHAASDTEVEAADLDATIPIPESPN